MNPLRELEKYGQSFWMDYIRRDVITGGELARLIEEDGLKGVTSNPSIFAKAISGSSDYDHQLKELLAENPRASEKALYEALAIRDIQMAADVLLGVHDSTGGADGFVSLEVSPHLADDTEGTIEEARRLWRAVDRPNLMVKVPATAAGVPAFETLTAEGININVTLMFSLDDYERISGAYLRGLERCEDPERVSSVASFFVSRVDTKVDAALEEIGGEALARRGKAGIANAKIAYQRFRETFHGQPFARQRRRGARVQRVLWGSTSTKNPDYRDVLYVEELIGPETVNTIPPETAEAFRDHGRARASLEEGLEEAEEQLQALAALGIDLGLVTRELQDEGVRKFADSFDELLATLERKREEIPAGVEG